MEPGVLIESGGVWPGALPAPWWFIQFFKVLGFTLHAVMMHLWYAGLLWAMYLAVWGGVNGREAAGRLMRQMPVLVALGINLGIVPLLFLQAAYAKVFYPATIYMAWFWLGIVALLIPAYYGVYIYSFGLRRLSGGDVSPSPKLQLANTADASPELASGSPSVGQEESASLGGQQGLLPPMPTWRLAAGWASALLFVLIGFLFVNGLTLMTRQELFQQEKWQAVWEPHTVAGAALGTGLNLADSRLLPRWLMFFSLAWTTLVVWLVVDTAWRASQPSDPYRNWVTGTSWKLYLAGAVGFAIFGSWYLHTWSAEVRAAMFSWPMVVLTVLTAISPGPVWLGLGWSAWQGRPPGRTLAVGLALGQLAVLALNATSRQVVQNLELGRFYAVSQQPQSIQWSPMVVFLLLFVLGAAVLGWMLLHLWHYRRIDA
ncbi:MAG: hypothetical protein NZ602_16220 [Thermoguttaceae bacterium]|nr:hypothetical protein [Thermoguttaceae bacterium]MDW8038378.1 hypothetical protein [Thermoguttaceae bacterium]